MATPPTDKDVIYIDIDDDITTIIDKVRSSGGKVVALVLPKRATVFQSIVNMKLLKRSAEGAKKHLVLVTSEPTLLTLAGAVGLFVAETAQSKPEIPLSIPVNSAVQAKDDEPVSLDEGPAEGFTAENAGEKSVGELASANSTVPTRPDGIETLTLPEEAVAEDEAETAVADTKKPSKEKHLKIPNFNKFRIRLILAILLVLIIVGIILAVNILPKATIKIGTNTSDTNVSLTMTLSPSAQSLNLNTLTTPARSEQQQQTTSQQVNTTGQQNNGTAATGSVTMLAQECNVQNPTDVPAGTGVSQGGLTYITQQDTSFTTYNGFHNGCFDFSSPSATPITAQSGGTKYNTSGSVNFTVSGRPDVTASGSASGGTDDIVQVVAQADIDSATQKLASQSTSSIKGALEQQLMQDGLYPLPATFNAGTPTVTSSSPVGSPATTVTVTQAITYTMYGVKQSYLDALIANNVDSQINTTNQMIINDGLSSSTITVVSASSSSEQVSLQTTAVVGPDIKVADIKKEVAGKLSGDAQTIISQLPGVTSVTVHLSPFWVSSVPTNPSKVTVTIGKAT